VFVEFVQIDCVLVAVARVALVALVAMVFVDGAFVVDQTLFILVRLRAQVTFEGGLFSVHGFNVVQNSEERDI
jgi:hypothetical protein